MHAGSDDADLKPPKSCLARRPASILAPGQRSDIEVTDVDLAGGYDRWHGTESGVVRIVEDICPPRVNLDFVPCGADGKVLRQGSRKLRDPAFISRVGDRPGFAAIRKIFAGSVVAAGLG